MRAKERLEKIKVFVNDYDRVSISFLQQQLEVSKKTVYRDIQELEENGFLRRVKKGAIRIDDSFVQSDSSFFKRIELNKEKKLDIVKKSIELIDEGDSIGLDAGSTSYLLATQIIKLNLPNLTIVSNNIIAIIELAKNTNLNILVIGGILRNVSFVSSGPVAEKMLEEIQLSKVFITAEGISDNGRLSDPNISGGVIKKKIMDKSKIKILILDSTKFGVTSLYNFAHISEFNYIITNKDLNKNHYNMLKENGLNIILI